MVAVLGSNKNAIDAKAEVSHSRRAHSVHLTNDRQWAECARVLCCAVLCCAVQEREIVMYVM
jgi:hypothetical protein